MNQIEEQRERDRCLIGYVILINAHNYLHYINLHSSSTYNDILTTARIKCLIDGKIAADDPVLNFIRDKATDKYRNLESSEASIPK